MARPHSEFVSQFMQAPLFISRQAIATFANRLGSHMAPQCARNEATTRLRESRARSTLDVMNVRLKRAYEPAVAADGYRILIDRLWPRGVARGEARLDEWARELAPSAELRRWFGHDPARFEEFRRRYTEELASQEAKLRELRRRVREGTLTLVYGARDTEHNDAVVLAEILRRQAQPRSDEKGDP